MGFLSWQVHFLAYASLFFFLSPLSCLIHFECFILLLHPSCFFNSLYFRYKIRSRICKRLRSPGIDSNVCILCILAGRYYSLIWNRFRQFMYRAGIDSWAPWTFTNLGSGGSFWSNFSLGDLADSIPVFGIRAHDQLSGDEAGHARAHQLLHPWGEADGSRAPQQQQCTWEHTARGDRVQE
jgi:hypothetical protein